MCQSDESKLPSDSSTSRLPAAAQACLASLRATPKRERSGTLADMLLFNMRAACFARATPAQILEPLDLPDQRLLEQSPKYRKNRRSPTPLYKNGGLPATPRTS